LSSQEPDGGYVLALRKRKERNNPLEEGSEETSVLEFLRNEAALLGI
jgi:hypothetical protein